jgi:hypothetical protein
MALIAVWNMPQSAMNQASLAEHPGYHVHLSAAISLNILVIRSLIGTSTLRLVFQHCWHFQRKYTVCNLRQAKFAVQNQCSVIAAAVATCLHSYNVVHVLSSMYSLFTDTRAGSFVHANV